jgi:predicted nucleic acid-binding protein
MILLDSSFIMAYSNEADVNHAKALSIIKDIERDKHGTPIITDYVFDEVVTVMLMKTKKLGKSGRTRRDIN